MIVQSLRIFLLEEEAATAVEYAVMLAMILIACLATISAVGTMARDVWDTNANNINSVLGGGS